MTETALEIDNLVYRYPGAPEPSVRVGSLRIARGERVVLTGSSGSGKSTLLHLLLGLMEPARGRVVVCGQDIHALRGSRRDRFRGRSIGMVFQSHHLLTGFSAIDNVCAALRFSGLPKKEHAERARSLLDSLGIDRPGSVVDELSIGQQQRVAVARAVACEPAVVLADEPTAALDHENALAAVDLLEGACARIGAALVCVTHDLSLVDRFERHERLDALANAQAGGV